MSIDDDMYALLGVSPTVTPKELRQAYLQLLVTAHPDKGGSSERFAAIQKAYAILSDPTKRAMYDEQAERKNLNKTNSSRSNDTPSHSSVTTNSNGVTAFVHGQTNFPPERQDHLRFAGGATFAGQPVPSSTNTAASPKTSSNSVISISEKILLLKKISRPVSISSTKRKLPAPSPEEIQQRKRSLAELYTQRAALHFAAGREHHATFDAEEALRIWPGYSQAVELLGKLKEKLSAVRNQSEEEEKQASPRCTTMM
jgi:curved DNA-binding protein CbpA